jgi:fructose transport system permease protein
MSTTAPPAEPRSAAEQFAARQQSPVQRIQHALHSHPTISPALVLVIAFVAFSTTSDKFATANTMSLVLQQVSIIGALAIGQTLIILTAGIDLSVGAVTILAMMVMAGVAHDHGVPAPIAFLVGIAVGTFCGFVNGALVTRLNLPPFIATLGTLSVFTALTLLYTQGESIFATDLPSFLSWTRTAFDVGGFRLTYGVLVVAVMYLVIGFALSQTAWGRHVYAVGDDREGSRLAGIKVKRVLMSVYVVAGLLYGLTGWILIGRSGSASPNGLVDANLDSITAVVIGGTSLFGGRGAVLGTALGALIVGVFRTGLSLAGVDDQYRVLAIGLLIIIAVSADQWIRKVKA